MKFAAVVLAGGEGRRFGGPHKPHAVVGDKTMLEHVRAAVADAARIVVVGPEVCGGPVAALAAGLDEITEPVTVVLAADQPFVAPAISHLLSEVVGHDLAMLTDSVGAPNHLAAAWQTAALRRRLAAIGDPADQSMRRLGAETDAVFVPDLGRWGHDCDTPVELERARERARQEQW